MTPAGPSSYTLNPDTPALTPLAAPSATTLGIIARSAAPVSVDLPAVKTSQIPSAVIQAIYRLDDAVSAEGLQWQPVIAYITATTPTGNPIITTEPKLITAPDGIEFSGNIPLHSNDGDTTLATTLETPAWQLTVIGDNDLRAAYPDAVITLNVATILPRFDLSRTPAVIPRRRADDSAFCTVTLAPSRFSAAARPGPGRQAAIASAIATFDSTGAPKSTPRSYTSVMLSPPHSFTARHAAVAPGIVLWSDPTVSRALPPCASTFAAATGSVAWHAAVKVTFADGSSLVTATEGLDHAPLSFGPILSYPAPDAVSIHIIVKAAGHPVRSGTFPLSPDPSRRRAIYIHSTLTPFTLPDTRCLHHPCPATRRRSLPRHHSRGARIRAPRARIPRHTARHKRPGRTHRLTDRLGLWPLTLLRIHRLRHPSPQRRPHQTAHINLRHRPARGRGPMRRRMLR